MSLEEHRLEYSRPGCTSLRIRSMKNLCEDSNLICQLDADCHGETEAFQVMTDRWIEKYSFFYFMNLKIVQLKASKNTRNQNSSGSMNGEVKRKGTKYAYVLENGLN